MSHGAKLLQHDIAESICFVRNMPGRYSWRTRMLGGNVLGVPTGEIGVQLCREAHRYAETGHPSGKVVIQVQPAS